MLKLLQLTRVMIQLTKVWRIPENIVTSCPKMRCYL